MNSLDSVDMTVKLSSTMPKILMIFCICIMQRINFQRFVKILDTTHTESYYYGRKCPQLYYHRRRDSSIQQGQVSFILDFNDLFLLKLKQYCALSHSSSTLRFQENDFESKNPVRKLTPAVRKLTPAVRNRNAVSIWSIIRRRIRSSP